MNEMPNGENVVRLDQVRIDRNAGNVCRCGNERRVVINSDSRQVYCDSCGAQLDPIDTLIDLAAIMEKRNNAMDKWLEQAEFLKNYKPKLKTIRALEKQYRGKKVFPTCPACSEPFYLEELTHWMHRLYAQKRIKNRQKEQKQ